MASVISRPFRSASRRRRIPGPRSQPRLGEPGAEPFHPLVGAEVERHLCPQDPDPPVAGGQDRLGHLAPGAAVADPDDGVHRLAVDVHDLDHRTPARSSIAREAAECSSPATTTPVGRPDSISKRTFSSRSGR
jgi:hypothetical protein